MGYTPGWKLLHASDFGVPQLRPRVLMVAVRKEASSRFQWPETQVAPRQLAKRCMT